MSSKPVTALLKIEQVNTKLRQTEFGKNCENNNQFYKNFNVHDFKAKFATC